MQLQCVIHIFVFLFPSREFHFVSFSVISGSAMWITQVGFTSQKPKVLHRCMWKMWKFCLPGSCAASQNPHWFGSGPRRKHPQNQEGFAFTRDMRRAAIFLAWFWAHSKSVFRSLFSGWIELIWAICAKRHVFRRIWVFRTEWLRVAGMICFVSSAVCFSGWIV